MHLTLSSGRLGPCSAARCRKGQPGQALVERGVVIAFFIIVAVG